MGKGTEAGSRWTGWAFLMTSIQSAVNDWLEIIRRAKSARTHKTYKSSASVFLSSLEIPVTSSIAKLDESHFGAFLQRLKTSSPRTEKHHATIITLFFEYIAAKKIATVNMDAIRFMRRNETRKVPKRLRRMDFSAVAKVAATVPRIEPAKADLVTARAKALVLLMAESGLRAFEAIGLRKSDLDFEMRRGVVIGKGDKEARFVLGAETIKAIRAYHAVRGFESEWIFTSHSPRHSKAAHPINTDSARADVRRICSMLLDADPEYRITPHQFRHFFATRVWRETGDIVQAQTALRHDNIATTQGYVHTGDEDLEKLEASLGKK